MRYEKPIMEVFKLDCFEVITTSSVTGDVPSDGTNEDVNKLPEVW